MARKRKTASKWIRSEADERRVEAGHYFDERDPERFCEFGYEFGRHYQGDWAGRPFELQEWQYRDIVAPIYGWKLPDGRRCFFDAYIEIVKKMGKTTLGRIMAMYGLIADGEPGAVVGLVAVDRAQGGLLYDGIAATVRLVPELSCLDVIESQKRIVHRATNSTLFVLSADAPSKEGLNISTLIRDELHAWPRGTMFETLRYAGAARRQPLFVSITTAGIYDPTSIGWQQHEYARKVLDGTIVDLNFFSYICAADPADDWTSPDTWKKANPSLGVTVRFDELEAQCRAAQHSVGLENSFKRYRLNIWTQSTERWLPLSTFDASAGHPIVEAEYEGRKFYGGIDLGSVSDLSVAALLFDCPHTPGAVDVVLRAFLPAAALRDGKNAGLYQQWERDGWLTVTPGNITDEGMIVSALVADRQRFGCHSVAIDRLFQAMRLSADLAAQGLEVFPCGMGTLSLSPLVTELEKLILSKRFHHGGHPILRAAVDAVEMEIDSAGNRKPSRRDRGKKIDALIACLLGLDRKLRTVDTPAPSPSLYFMGGARV
jgi:phage terminase large subunit-like protein